MLLTEMNKEIENKGYFIGSWDCIEEAKHLDVECSSGLSEFSDILTSANLSCLPKIINGTVANLDKSLSGIQLVIFNNESSINKKNNDVRYGLLVGKIAAVIAKLDGEIGDDEIAQIGMNIYKLSCLSESEKHMIFIRSLYAIQQKSHKEILLKEFSVLSVKAKGQALNIAKNIVIADLCIDTKEKLFLKELYKLSGIPTNTIAKDLKLLAEKEHLVLVSKEDKNMIEEVLPVFTVDASFDDMITEFEQF